MKRFLNWVLVLSILALFVIFIFTKNKVLCGQFLIVHILLSFNFISLKWMSEKRCQNKAHSSLGQSLLMILKWPILAGLMALTLIKYHFNPLVYLFSVLLWIVILFVNFLRQSQASSNQS